MMVIERTKPRILLVEDEKNLGSTLSELLAQEGYDPVWAKTKEEALTEVRGRKFELALLDVGLPDGNGFEVAEEIRKTRIATAIVFLTAFGSPDDRVRGLELGAEDYIVKPFHLKELLLRIQNALKRTKYVSDSVETVRVGKATIHFSRYELVSEGASHALTQKECTLLKLLVDRKGVVVSRDEILNFVWTEDEFPSPRTIDNFIMKFRRWIETDPENPTIIKSVRGVGYQVAEEGVQVL